MRLATSSKLLAAASAALLASAVGLVALGQRAPAQQQKSTVGKAVDGSPLPTAVKTFETKYYTMYTDLVADEAQEATLRMTRMAEEYYERTKSFSGKMNQRLPFYLFRDRNDYYAAGGIQGSGGVYMVRGNDKRLMAIAGKETNANTWHTVQHEGFHQFADATIGQMPPWINEGLAEYFGEAIWTGDGFVCGVIPPRRLKEVKDRIEGKKFRTIPSMMNLTLREWNSDLAVENYHQGWAMAHFLAHGDDGKYQGAFVNFMRAMNRGMPWQKAWDQAFGSAAGFETKWAAWWTRQPEDPTAQLYSQAVLSILASHIARAHSKGQDFSTLDGFVSAVKSEEFKLTGDDWLPPKLLTAAIAGMKRDDTKFEIEPPATKAQPPKVIATRADGTRLVASFPARHSLPVKVTVDIDDLVPATAKAKELIAAGKKSEAKAVLQDAMKRSPKSPATADAKAALLETK